MIEVFCDGSSLGNPGPGGYGAAAFREKAQTPFMESAEGFENTTNGYAESYALYAALYLIDEIASTEADAREFRIVTDSKYVADSFGIGKYPTHVPPKTGWMFGWAKSDFNNAKKHPEIWREIYNRAKALQMKGVTVHVSWVKAHAGNVRNEYVDKLARGEAEKIRSTL